MRPERRAPSRGRSCGRSGRRARRRRAARRRRLLDRRLAAAAAAGGAGGVARRRRHALSASDRAAAAPGDRAPRHGVDADCVVAGAGSVELIWALARAFGGPGRRVGWVRARLRRVRARRRAPAAPRRMAVSDVDDRAGRSRWLRGATGQPDAGACRRSSAARAAAGRRRGLSAAVRRPRADGAVARTWRSCARLTKLFALPGLRLGYLLASPPVAAAVRASLPPWNVSQPAIAAGLAALARADGSRCARAVAALRERLVARLAALSASHPSPPTAASSSSTSATPPPSAAALLGARRPRPRLHQLRPAVAGPRRRARRRGAGAPRSRLATTAA